MSATAEQKKRQRIEQLAAFLVLTIPTIATGYAIASLGWRPITALDISLFVLFYFVTSIGITFGYHRLLTHNSFRCKPAVKKAATIAAAMSVQGPAIWWVAHHRRHHQFSDKQNDTHSPHLTGDTVSEKLRGFLHAHMGWMLHGHKTSARKFAGALLNDADVVKIDKLYFVWVALSLALPAGIAAAVTLLLEAWPLIQQGQFSQVPLMLQGEGLAATLTKVQSAALGGLLWGGFVRIVAVHHATWSVNSICHLFGRRPFQSTDKSTNNFVVAMLTSGEGWHNGHHAFPVSARHGLLRGEFDLTWMIIKGLSRVGLVWDIKLPTPAEIKRNTLKTDNQPHRQDEAIKDEQQLAGQHP